MNKSRLFLTLTGLSLMAATACGLASVRSRQTLGKPGVLLVPVAIHDDSGKVCAETSVFLPESAGRMTSTLAPITQMEITALPSDTSFGRRIYKDPNDTTNGFQAQVSVVLMGADRTSIHKPEFCLSGQGWTIEKQETDTLHFEHPRPYDIPFQKFTARATGKDPQTGRMFEVKGLYLFWFVADNMVTESHAKRVWWLARDLVLHQVLDRWAYISYFTVCPPGQEEKTFERMKELMLNTAPEIQNSFRDARPALQAAAITR